MSRVTVGNLPTGFATALPLTVVNRVGNPHKWWTLVAVCLYRQAVLGYSALGTGLRLLLLSVGILVTSGLTGSLSAHVRSGC